MLSVERPIRRSSRNATSGHAEALHIPGSSNRADLSNMAIISNAAGLNVPLFVVDPSESPLRCLAQYTPLQGIVGYTAVVVDMLATSHGVAPT